MFYPYFCDDEELHSIKNGYNLRLYIFDIIIYVILPSSFLVEDEFSVGNKIWK